MGEGEPGEEYGKLRGEVSGGIPGPNGLSLSCAPIKRMSVC